MIENFVYGLQAIFSLFVLLGHKNTNQESQSYKKVNIIKIDFRSSNVYEATFTGQRSAEFKIDFHMSKLISAEKCHV